MEVKSGRTPAYVCTLDPMSCGDMEQLACIRAAVAAANRTAERVYTKYGSSYVAKQRVTVKGRKPIQKQLVNVGGYYGKPKLAWRGHTPFGDIVGGLANAGEYDIYIHQDRRNWEYA